MSIVHILVNRWAPLFGIRETVLNDRGTRFRGKDWDLARYVRREINIGPERIALSVGNGV